MEKGFFEAWRSLRQNQQHDCIQELCERCGWSEPVFRNKRAGRTELRKAEADVVKSVFEAYGIDAWTGKLTSFIQR